MNLFHFVQSYTQFKEWKEFKKIFISIFWIALIERRPNACLEKRVSLSFICNFSYDVLVSVAGLKHTVAGELHNLNECSCTMRLEWLLWWCCCCCCPTWNDIKLISSPLLHALSAESLSWHDGMRVRAALWEALKLINRIAFKARLEVFIQSHCFRVSHHI